MFLLLMAACQQDPTIVSPPTFERPGDVAFACFDSTERVFVDQTLCEGDPDENRYATIALVTQTASGEVGAVDLRLNVTLDANVLVPGFTFVRVGEAPSGVVVPSDPTLTYVANFGSRSVQWINTARFHSEALRTNLREEGVVSLPDGPTDLVISPSGDALFVSMPRDGTIVSIVRDPNSGALTQPTDASATALDTTFAQATLGEPSEERHSCNLPAGLQEPSAAEPGDPIVLGADDMPSAKPESLVVDGDTLLVADSALPIIHRFTIGAGGALTPLPPLSPGVPVLRLAVTPAVPENVDGVMTDSARFLYAIDAVDQSVLVLDYTEGAPSFGNLIPVRIGEGRGDRVRLPADAISLGVLTPSFPSDDPCVADDDRSPSQLRGVFVAVGLTNGTFVVVDILDLDAGCRGFGDADGCGGTVETDVIYASQRHRARVGTLVADPVQLVGAPVLSFRGSPGLLDENGQPSAEGDPRLDVLELGGEGDNAGCPAFMTRVWGEDASYLCVSGDPWLSRDETWRARYEAVRPAAVGGLGRFEGSLASMSAADGFFCTRGVIGGDDIAASNLTADDPEVGYEGDLLVITSDPPASRVAEEQGCEVFEENIERDRVRPQFRVVAAQPRALSLAVETPQVDPALIFRCYGDAFFEYEVRVRNAYLVSGSGTGVEHRVIESGGACRIDTDGQPADPNDPTSIRSSFARSGSPYVNPHVAFAINDQGRVPDDDSELRFQITGSPRDLARDVGARPNTRRPALVEALVYNPGIDRLFALDSNSDGFIEYELTPLQAVQIFE
ncbi:MAG: hypothetical protein AAF938_18805 [Myxococcota bacterium]